MLRTKNLTYSFPNQKPLSFPDLLCSKGEHWLLLGQSGSGKTTLLHLLAGLRSSSSGEIYVSDQDLGKFQGAQLDRFRGQNIGIIFQQSHFVRALSLLENLRLAQILAGLSVSDQRIREITGRLGIAHKLFSKPQRLSMGEQQRASIARAIVNKPKIILADEPTSALDDYHCLEVINLLKEEASAEQITLLIVTHDNRLKTEFNHSVTLEKQ